MLFCEFVGFKFFLLRETTANLQKADKAKLNLGWLAVECEKNETTLFYIRAGVV